jgi:hypothetical protein
VDPIDWHSKAETIDVIHSPKQIKAIRSSLDHKLIDEHRTSEQILAEVSFRHEQSMLSLTHNDHHTQSLLPTEEDLYT